MATLTVEDVLANVLDSDDEDDDFGKLDSDSDEDESLDCPAISSLSGEQEMSLDFIQSFSKNLTIENSSHHSSDNSDNSDSSQHSADEEVLNDLEVMEYEEECSS